MFNKKTYHRTLKPYDVSGSGRKPREQKGSGRARLGNLRGSGKKKPGKSWGHIPKIFAFTIPVKIKLKGLQSVLSAKLAEGKVIIVDQFPEKSPHPEDLKKSILGSRSDNTKMIVVTSKDDTQSIKGGLDLIKNFKQTDPNGVNVLDMVNHDKIVFTKKSLEEFQRLFLAWTFEQYRPMAIKDDYIASIVNVNPDTSQPDQIDSELKTDQIFEPKFKIL